MWFERQPQPSVEAGVAAVRPTRRGSGARRPSGAALSAGDRAAEVEFALACGAHDAGEDLLGVGALAGAVAAAHLADDDGGPDGLFGAPVGGVDRRVPQER